MRWHLYSHHLNVVTATSCINKILLNNYLNVTLQSLQYYYFNIIFLRVKSWKSGVIRSFHMKFSKKSGIAQNQEKSGIIRKIRKYLTDCVMLLDLLIYLLEIFFVSSPLQQSLRQINGDNFWYSSQFTPGCTEGKKTPSKWRKAWRHDYYNSNLIRGVGSREVYS